MSNGVKRSKEKSSTGYFDVKTLVPVPIDKSREIIKSPRKSAQISAHGRDEKEHGWISRKSEVSVMVQSRAKRHTYNTPAHVFAKTTPQPKACWY